VTRKPEDLTLSDLPDADATRFEEWKRLHRRARIAPFLGLIAYASSFITVPLIGGAIGWFLPILLWFAYMFAHVMPLAGRERQLAAELGVPAALGLTADQVARTERRVKLAKVAGVSLLGLVAIWVVVVIVSVRSDRGTSAARMPAQELAESYIVRLKDNPELYRGAKVKARFFETARVTPFAGRFFLPSEHHANAAPVVVISHDVWQRLFGSDLGILGRSIEFNGSEVAVIAIAPAGFRVPARADFWTPAGESR
jgi:MacB-like protein